MHPINKVSFYFTLIVISVLFEVTNLQELEDPIVETKYGLVKGIEAKSHSGRPYFSFRGIPYAQPPVEDLRFRPPEDPIPWKGIFDARNNSKLCIQKNYLFENPKVQGSEDCLYLNVYTPKLRLSHDRSNGLLPVMVFIHWGGFFAGYSGSDYLGPEYFMDRDVVLVTFNYRLGVLGFFSTNDDAAPGNYGLKDQVAALKWVQSNIENFGGNKKKVTLFGQSAGGASVHYHMLSPESKNLFHQGISMSGTALALWAKPFPKQQQLIAKAQARLVGCHRVKSSHEIVECLRKIKAEDLVNSGDKFKYFSVDPLNVYQPSIEKRSGKNPRPFLTKDPVDYIRNKEFLEIPWIVGTVNNEGLIRAEPLLRKSETRSYLKEHFNDLMPNLLALTLSNVPENSGKLWRKIRENYFKETENIVDGWDEHNIEGLINLYTDRSFAYSAYQSALFHKIKGHQDIWFYNFNYTGQYSYGNLFAATKENLNYDWGVSHCDDLIYLFKSPTLLPQLSSANDLEMSKTMVKMWTDFATYGDPTPKFKFWEKVDKSINKKLKHLSIEGRYNDETTPTKTMKIDLMGNRFKFWEDMPLMENIKELNETQVELL